MIVTVVAVIIVSITPVSRWGVEVRSPRWQLHGGVGNPRGGEFLCLCAAGRGRPPALQTPSPAPCPTPQPGCWHSRRTGQDPRQVPQKLQEAMARGSAPRRPVPHHRSRAGSLFPRRDGDAGGSARRGDALAMPLGCGCSWERWQRYLAAARPGRPQKPPAPQQARVCVRGPVARPCREVCSACPAARGEVADATEPAAGRAVKASASFLRGDQMKRCGQGSCRHGPKSGRVGLTSGVCPGPAPALGNGTSGGRVRPPHLGGFLAWCRAVVAVALVAVALVAAWSQGCPLQPASLPSTPGCVLAELLFHPVPRRMQLGHPGPSNPPWSSLEAPWAPGTCEEKSRGRRVASPARGGPCRQPFHPRTGRSAPARAVPRFTAEGRAASPQAVSAGACGGLGSPRLPSPLRPLQPPFSPCRGLARPGWERGGLVLPLWEMPACPRFPSLSNSG